MQSLVFVPPNGNYDRLYNCVELALKDGYILSTVSNVGAVEHDIIGEEIPGIDGVHVLGQRRGPRELPCTVYVHGTDRENMYRRRFELINSLSGTGEGWLYYKNDYITVRTRGIPILPADFKERIENYNKCDIKFYCADPNWQSLDTETAHIAYAEGVGLKFPTEMNAIKFGVRTMRVTINCQSAVETPVRITVQGHGIIDSPTIRNLTSGESLTFKNLTMVNGDMLVIDTTPGSLSAEFTHNRITNRAFNLVEPMSTFWMLKPGNNLISYSARDNNQNASITLEWVNRYEGV